MGGRGSGRPTTADFEPAPDVDPWDRQPKETDKAWQAFSIYRGFGADRSVRKTLEQLGKKPSFKSHMEKWSVRWGWRMRASAWDTHRDRCEREVVLDQAAKVVREKMAVADGLWKTAAKALVMWNKYIDHQMKEDTAAGIPSEPPVSPSEVQRMADTGLKLSQLLEGKPTDINEQRAQITIDERRKGIQQLIGNPKLRAAMKQVTEAMKSDNGQPLH